LPEDQQRRTNRWPFVVKDGRSLKQAIRAAVAWLEVHAEEINALNVFPVPDGDTGTNMLLTCQAARDEMERAADTIPDIMRAVSHGSLMGARGNSGVILSQILRGMARSVDNKAILTARDVATAFEEGSSTAYKGVIKPVEGTILTVIRETAEKAATVVKQTDDIETLLDSAVRASRSSVERTPTLLQALRLAGVVDAGGYGLSVILEGMQRYLLRGEAAAGGLALPAHFERSNAPEEGFGYDIQFIIHGNNLDVAAIRDHLAGMGESALIVGDETTIKVHIHAPNPGPIIEYGAAHGPLSHVIVENMQQQFEELRDRGSEAGKRIDPAPVQNLLASQATTAAQITGISTIVVASGAGFEALFKSLDASAIIPGGQTMNPSTQQILAAIESVPTDQVIILPNNKNIILTAEQAHQLSKKNVVVVPTKTIPEGIAALLALNYDASLDANRVAMEQAAARVATAEITTAVRTTHLDGIDVGRSGAGYPAAHEH
jgi:DAK2 domain fusion protein YloV